MDKKKPRLLISLDGVDRISKLPDDVLSHILSYLPTKYSVRTRILSTRWKYIFTLVPVLDFSSPRNCYTQASIQPFLDFVNFVINSYDVHRMYKFSYRSCSFLAEYEGCRLDSWILDSVNRGVRELCVTEILKIPQKLPQNVFTSWTLTVVNLRGDFILDVPDNVWLPCVRIFDLLGLRFISDESARRLFQSCPVLENLVLNNCCTENIKVLDICVPSLVNLKIHGLKDEYQLVLEVPNMKYFEYEGYESLGFSSRGRLKSLIDVSVSFSSWSFAGFEALTKLVALVAHIESLRICGYTVEAFRRFGLTQPTFQNLTSLEMRVPTSLDFDLGSLFNLLDMTPRLDVLVLDNECSSELEPNGSVPEHVPICVSTHLKVIEFRGFSLLAYEYKLVKYFLKNAKFLHTMHIQTRENLEKQFGISKKLLAFSRCSKDCRVILESV